MNEEVYIDYEMNRVLIINNNVLTPEEDPVCVEMTINEYQLLLENKSAILAMDHS